MLSPLDTRGGSDRSYQRDGAALVSPPLPGRRPTPLPPGIVRLVLENARVLARRWRGELLVSEVLARLCDEHEPAFRALCARARDPGRVVRSILPPLWTEG
ncbi:MAG: hypothetical protein ACF8XB_18495 [Planctomycetota bacterium JB042]